VFVVEFDDGYLGCGVGKEDSGEIGLGRELNWILIGTNFYPVLYSNSRVI
jgi:hypothetical protein